MKLKEERHIYVNQSRSAKGSGVFAWLSAAELCTLNLFGRPSQPQWNKHKVLTAYQGVGSCSLQFLRVPDIAKSEERGLTINRP